jgi:hypothetical protein
LAPGPTRVPVRSLLSPQRQETARRRPGARAESAGNRCGIRDNYRWGDATVQHVSRTSDWDGPNTGTSCRRRARSEREAARTLERRANGTGSEVADVREGVLRRIVEGGLGLRPRTRAERRGGGEHGRELMIHRPGGCARGLALSHTTDLGLQKLPSFSPAVTDTVRAGSAPLYGWR